MECSEGILAIVDDFRFIFAYTLCMAFFRSDTRQIYCVLCKRCHRNVPAGVTEQPKKYFAVTCILCRESRLYLPTEVGLDFPHHEVAQRARWAK